MPKVAIHRNQLTLPEELRAALTLLEDDSLDAEEVDEGILLRRSPSARRRAGIEDIRAAQAGVVYRGALPRPDADQEEGEIADLLAADKRAGSNRKR
jgi:bifunctional DNA-binding transcriptional regulator/antitoxin component of YhaV-PrlF toxin-antitoxin module